MLLSPFKVLNSINSSKQHIYLKTDLALPTI